MTAKALRTNHTGGTSSLLLPAFFIRIKNHAKPAAAPTGRIQANTLTGMPALARYNDGTAYKTYPAKRAYAYVTSAAGCSVSRAFSQYPTGIPAIRNGIVPRSKIINELYIVVFSPFRFSFEYSDV